MDRKVLEERLTCRETVVTGSTSVLRVATRLNGLVSALAAAAASNANAGTDGAAAVAAAHDALVKELMLMRLEVGLGLGWMVCVGAGRMHDMTRMDVSIIHTTSTPPPHHHSWTRPGPSWSSSRRSGRSSSGTWRGWRGRRRRRSRRSAP